MNIGDFYRIIKEKGALVTITRPLTKESFKVYMARHTGGNEQTLLEEAKQKDEKFIFCELDFRGQAFTSPQEGDRILDSDGLTEFAVERMERMQGLSNEIWGWRTILRG